MPFAGLKAHASTLEPAVPSRRDASAAGIGCTADSLTHVLDFVAVSSPEPVRIPERPSGVDLRVNVGTVRLKNPIIAASGTFGYGVEFAHLVDLNRLGGIVVKGLSREPMAGTRRPECARPPAG